MWHPLIKALRYSERYTGTDMVYLVQGSFWVFLGHAATGLSGLILLVMLANYVPKDTLGEYRFLLTILTLLAIFCLPGLDIALIQSTARGYSGQLQSTTKNKLHAGILGSGIGILIAGYYASRGNQPLAYSCLIIAGLLPWYGAYFISFSYLQGKKLFQQAAILQTLSRTGFLIVMILIAWTIPNTSALIGGFMLTTIFGQYVAQRWIIARHPESINRDPKLLGYGIHLTLIGVFPLIGTQADRLLIWHQLGAAELAIYTIATLLPLEAQRIGLLLGQVALPKMVAQNTSLRILWRKVALLEIGLLTGWLSYALLAPYLFAWFFPDYPEAITVSIIAMGLILSAPNQILRSHFIAQKRTRVLNVALVVPPLIQTLALVVLVPQYGLVGALAGLFIGQICESIIWGGASLYSSHQQTLS